MLLTYISIASASAVIINPVLLEFDLSSGAVEWSVSIFLLGLCTRPQIIYEPKSLNVTVML